MKKIITAIGNKNLNQKLKQENTINVIGEDIQYREGILEVLKENEDIDFLILSELLSGQIEFKQLIDEIKKINNNIQIIIFLEKNNRELENYLYAKGICYIFYNNQISISEIIRLINDENKNSNQELKREVEKLKQILLEKEEINNFNNNKNKLIKKIQNKINQKNNLKEKYREEINKNTSNIICVSGTSGVGKSIFSINLAKSFMDYNNKILIIDFDILNNSLHTILGIKKYPEKIKNKIKNNNLLNEIKIEDLIIKINSKIDLISGINLLFDSKYQISSTKIKLILTKLKEKYEKIIIDTSSECFFDYTKEIFKNSNINIFITEANLTDIKKSKKLLNIYINEWQIPKNYFNILFNKYNNNSIDISILKNIFSEFSILGKLEFNPKYNLLINKNDKSTLEKNIKKEYLKINQNLLNQNKNLNSKISKNNFLKILPNIIKNKYN